MQKKMAGHNVDFDPEIGEFVQNAYKTCSSVLTLWMLFPQREQ